MDAAAELGRNSVSKLQIQPEYEMSKLTRDGTAEPVSRDQILRHARGQGNIHFPCSADHEQDWQPYPVDPYSAICDDHTYHTDMMFMIRHLQELARKNSVLCILYRPYQSVRLRLSNPSLDSTGPFWRATEYDPGHSSIPR